MVRFKLFLLIMILLPLTFVSCKQGPEEVINEDPEYIPKYLIKEIDFGDSKLEYRSETFKFIRDDEETKAFRRHRRKLLDYYYFDTPSDPKGYWGMWLQRSKLTEDEKEMDPKEVAEVALKRAITADITIGEVKATDKNEKVDLSEMIGVTAILQSGRTIQIANKDSQGPDVTQEVKYGEYQFMVLVKDDELIYVGRIHERYEPKNRWFHKVLESMRWTYK